MVVPEDLISADSSESDSTPAVERIGGVSPFFDQGGPHLKCFD